MKDEIISKLHQIEKEYQVTVLYAVESGSRAWGFESKDSDYDIRFIYAHPLEWYITIEDKRGVIEIKAQGSLDFSGWDIRKALGLYKRSNPPLYEWLISPIIYVEKGTLAQQLRDLSPRYYSPVTSIYHYLHMARGNYRQYLQGNTVRVKKYFYVLRPIFACMWIEQYTTQPPMEFVKILEILTLPDVLKKEIGRLYDRKKAGEELDKEAKITVINQFLDEKIKYFENRAKEMGTRQELKPDSTELDHILYETIKN